VPRLESFTLKSCVHTDFEFTYLKWLLNNLNHITKLEIYLHSIRIWKTDQLMFESVIDANFIRQYCLPDQIINLKYFYFYIYAERQSPLNNISKIVNSFKINSFFIDHQWTNVQCFYDEKTTYQHIFSSNLKKFQNSIVLFNRQCIYDWSDVTHSQDIHPSFSLFLKQFNELCPNVSSMRINIERLHHQSEILQWLPKPYDMRQRNLNTIPLRNVTKLRFGYFCRRRIAPMTFRYPDRPSAEILACLISMPVQLKYLFVQKFEWLLFAIQYGFHHLRKNALNTVRYAEFSISSCNIGNDHSIQIGKFLVPILNTYMPYLQTLRLWRPDDFPWTSNEHVIVFEQDLCQLFEQLKQLVYLDIYGQIDPKKVKPYHKMVQKRFPNSRNDIQISRFSLWI
ncbi:unnamed protein product, partial [Rotaria sp. Silwood2]